MRISKQARRDGKSLFRACLLDGRLEETRVRETTRRVLESKPRGYLAALTHFHRLLKLHLDSRRATVVNAVETPQPLQDTLAASLEQRYGPGLDLGFQVDPALLGGLRIRVGSDVYDGSIRARLEALNARF
ncbi:MAG: F0F1 ATP synthase subunit delta [Verrucomicrobiae bacterium]|nr:F0F1 ATP synthase subunit delta [Verrucomicrobiae bacterium]